MIMIGYYRNNKSTKMRDIRVIAAMAIAGCMALPVSGQDKVEATLGADLVSGYVWRGQKNGGFSIQPNAALSFKGLSLGAWGSFALAPNSDLKGTDEEIDLTLGYAVGGLHVGVTDYYLFNCGHPFFKYGSLDRTAHTFEAGIGYDFGVVALDWYTNFAGADGVDKDGHRAYSSYLTVGAPFRLAKLDWRASVGIVPYRTSFYAADDSHGFHVNDVSLRAEYTIALPHFSLPVYGQLTANPSSRELHYLIGFTVTAL